MKAVDTNVLVRLIIRDDPDQLKRAEAFCQQGVIVSLTVAMETEWVLRSRYAMSRAAVHAGFRTLMETDCFNFDKESALHWVLERYAAGAGFADMIHLVDASDADGFGTFDMALATKAGSAAPLPVIAI